MTTIVKRSVVVAGHQTSISLEEPFWKSLKEIAKQRRTTLTDLVAEIDKAATAAICRQRSACSCFSIIATR